MQPKQEKRFSGILLLGPTGSGKTPLGELLQARGLWGLRCLHFDFGHELRSSANNQDCTLSPVEREVILRMLKAGALLEDEHFPIAQKLLDDFMRRNQADRETLIVLNGLPRHLGQAEHLQEIVRLLAVISLECTPETVRYRIANNSGGDRTDRVDDSLAEVQRKLELFRQRTAPLLGYYRTRHVAIIPVVVRSATTPEDVLLEIGKPRGWAYRTSCPS